MVFKVDNVNVHQEADKHEEVSPISIDSRSSTCERKGGFGLLPVTSTPPMLLVQDKSVASGTAKCDGDELSADTFHSEKPNGVRKPDAEQSPSKTFQHHDDSSMSPQKKIHRNLVMLNRRPRKVTFDPMIRINPNELVNGRTPLNLDSKFNGMGPLAIIQNMADRGRVLHVGGALRWVGNSVEGSGVRHRLDLFSEEDDDDMTIGGPVDFYKPMTVSPSNTIKWRHRPRISSCRTANKSRSQMTPCGSTSDEDEGVLESENELSNYNLEKNNPDEEELKAAGWEIAEVTGILTPSPSPGSPDNENKDFGSDEIQFISPRRVTDDEPPAKRKRYSAREAPPFKRPDGRVYPKPGFSYSCLVALALKNSTRGILPVAQIYKFILDHFPYFHGARSGWKNSVRHNLSMNKWFVKWENPYVPQGYKKGFYWAINASKLRKMDEEVRKCMMKDQHAVMIAMRDPWNWDTICAGELKNDYFDNDGPHEASSGIELVDLDDDGESGQEATAVVQPPLSARSERAISRPTNRAVAVVAPLVRPIAPAQPPSVAHTTWDSLLIEDDIDYDASESENELEEELQLHQGEEVYEEGRLDII